MRVLSTRKLIAVAAAGVAVLGMSSASAGSYGSGSYGSGSYGGGGSYDGGGSYSGGGSYGDSFRAASYINRDTGAATENADVNTDSSCSRPDQYDMQAFSPAGTATKNVHNDACFLDDRGNKVGKGIGATYELRGVGFISACPDPDGAGPERSILSDTNGDGRNDRCVQTSYQDRGALGVADVAGDFEYHARINNNSAMTGDSDVTWGLDRELDGLGYRGNDDSVRIAWSADGKSGSSYGYSR